MRAALLLLLAGLCQVTFAQPTDPEKTVAEIRSLPWQRGPGTGNIAGKATLKLTEQDAFLNDQSTRRFLVLLGNPPRDGHYALVPTTSENWIGVFAFEETGYIKDDEKIDPDELMRVMKEHNRDSAEERRKLGLPPLKLLGWYVPPHYDQTTKRLEWGTKLEDERGQVVVNYTARVLGRTGIMNAILISEPESLDGDRKAFAARLTKLEYNPGERYTEFRQGDKVAEYGLAALVLGGAAAVATKKGLWAVIGGFLAAFWKVVAGAAIALLAGIKALFKRNKSSN